MHTLAHTHTHVHQDDLYEALIETVPAKLHSRQFIPPVSAVHTPVVKLCKLLKSRHCSLDIESIELAAQCFKVLRNPWFASAGTVCVQGAKGRGQEVAHNKQSCIHTNKQANQTSKQTKRNKPLLGTPPTRVTHTVAPLSFVVCAVTADNTPAAKTRRHKELARADRSRQPANFLQTPDPK